MMLKHLFSFSGRSGRLEYFIHSFSEIFGILAIISAISFIEGQFKVSVGGEIIVFSILGVILVGVIAETAVTVRRFHDLGMAGWHLFGMLVPFYNIYLSLILLFRRGEASRNIYGPGPRSKS